MILQGEDDLFNRIDTVTDALNRTLDYTYNTAGFLEKIVEPSGDYLFYGYNTTGRPVEESLHMASGARTFYRGIDYGTASNNPAISSGKPRRLLNYNQAGTALTATTFTYDSPGNLTGMADAKGNVTSYHYDLFKRPDRMTQPGDTVTVYTYDRHGNLATVRDAQENVTGYIYDDLGRLLETLSPDTGTTRYSYDEAGNLRFRIQNGKTEEYRYDVLGRLTQILSSDASRNVSLAYDTGTGSNLLGRLASVTDGSGTTRYGYDVQGRVISETKTIASETYVTSYGYDAAGNLRSITYPTGQTVQYVADTADPAKISGVKLNPSGVSLTLASGITYLPFGPASNILLGNNVSIARGYDRNYRLSDVYEANGHTVMDQAYTLDDTGNITAIADDLDPTRSKSFGYDALYRLTGATGIYGVLAYTYDKAGNRLTETKTGSQDAYDYFPYTSRLRSVTGTHAELIAYDADGNIASRTPGAANPTPAVTATSDYVYNAGGQRVMKTKNGAATVYHYDLDGRLIAETDDEGTLKQAYVWLNGEPLAMIASDGAVYYYHNDHLGTPQALTDQAVNLVWSADYLPFGQASVTTATVVNNLRFPGQVYDPETGLYYNWNRYYDPGLGRYITPDPIGLAGGSNLYSYTSNNPVNLIDPLGLQADLILVPYRSIEWINAYNTPSVPNTFIVAAHGTPYGILDSNKNYISIERLAKLMRANGYKSGMKVRLDSCNTGVSPGDGKLAPAQRLANELGRGTSVDAPNNYQWYDSVTVIPYVAPKLPGTNPPEADRMHMGVYIPFVGN